MRQVRTPGGLLEHPLLLDALHEAVLVGFLRAALPPIGEHDARPAPSSSIRRIADLMEAHPELSYGVDVLAELSGTTIRAVQQGFRRRFGVSPREYVRAVRLDRIRAELLDHPEAKVAGVAQRWGFPHAGRFSGEYLRRFDELPSQTIRRGARAA